LASRGSSSRSPTPPHPQPRTRVPAAVNAARACFCSPSQAASSSSSAHRMCTSPLAPACPCPRCASAATSPIPASAGWAPGPGTRPAPAAAWTRGECSASRDVPAAPPLPGHPAPLDADSTLDLAISASHDLHTLAQNSLTAFRAHKPATLPNAQVLHTLKMRPSYLREKGGVSWARMKAGGAALRPFGG
jgi:hypothetical protein